MRVRPEVPEPTGAPVVSGPNGAVRRRPAPRDPAGRARLGKDARKLVPLGEHAAVDAGWSGRDPVAMLVAEDATRVPELVPIRYGRMLVSPFTFFRGAAGLMAADLARTPVSGLRAQLCGDAHLSNFGLFASAERSLVFDINDFDETLPGPWEWDVKRLVTSLAIAGRDNGFTGKQRRRIALAAAAAYRDAMREFAGQTNLQVWYAQADMAEVLERRRAQLSPGQTQRTEAALARARSRDHLHAIGKLTEVVDGVRRIKSAPPIVIPVEELMPSTPADELMHQMQALLRGYGRSLPPDRRHLLSQFRLVHMARKVVGVGSVGTRSWILLLLGRDDGDPLFLQAKEAEASVLEEYAGASRPAGHGRRVVAGQRLIQASGDIFLGHHRVRGIDGEDREFYVRQLLDWKGSAVVEKMSPKGMTAYASLCAWTLARAHARSGDRIAIAAYLGSGERFDEAVADFAETYADVNESDFHRIQAAARNGLVEVRRGQ